MILAGGAGRPPTALVVDDDPRVLRLVGEVLHSGGFGVLSASDGDVVVGLVRAQQPDVVVLDLKMPRMPGLETLRALRAAGENAPVVVLTGVSEEQPILAAFEAGADDYVVKPFQPRVLLARVQAVLRRARGLSVDGDPATSERVGDVSLDARTHQAQVAGQVVPLSPTEFLLLRTLMRGAGRVFTVNDLLSQVWGPSYVGQDEIVRANIYRLRQKLEPVPSEPRYIQGRRGVGYYFTGHHLNVGAESR